MIGRIVLLGVMMVATAPAFAAPGFTPAQKTDIEAVVKNYLMEHPEVIFEAVQKKQENDEAAAAQAAKAVIKNRADEIFKNKAYTVLGSKDAKVTFAEFYDYNCGYCKHALPDLIKATTDNKDINIVLIDSPILGPTSLEAAKWAIAAGTFGKYLEFHKAAMAFTGPKSDENLTKLVTQIGLDPAKVKKVANSPETMEQINKNMELFQALGLQGTPGFVAPDRVLRGAVGPEVLNLVAKDILAARAKQ